MEEKLCSAVIFGKSQCNEYQRQPQNRIFLVTGSFGRFGKILLDLELTPSDMMQLRDRAPIIFREQSGNICEKAEAIFNSLGPGVSRLYV